MQPCLILLSSRLTQASTVRPYTDCSEKDARTLRFLVASRFTLALLLGCLAGTPAVAEPIIVNKPAMESPETRFDDAELQAKYDEAWKIFSETVDKASDTLTQELQAQLAKAFADGDLDLHDYWDNTIKDWGQTSEFEWDSASLLKQWGDRFGDSARFPNEVTVAAEKTAVDHKMAISALKTSYEDLERDLVKRSAEAPALIDKAREIRQEIKDLLGANNFQNQKRPRVFQPRRTARELRGVYSNMFQGNEKVFEPLRGTRDRGTVLIRYAGTTSDEGTWLMDKDGQGRVVWNKGYLKGKKTWRFLLFPNGLIALNEFGVNNAIVNDGYLLWQEGFDWRGEKCSDVVATPQAKAAVAGEWSHPNFSKTWEFLDGGEFVEHRKSGGINVSGKWALQSDGAYSVELNNKYKFRLWLHDGTLAALAFEPSGDIQNDGVVFQRVGDAPENK